MDKAKFAFCMLLLCFPTQQTPENEMVTEALEAITEAAREENLEDMAAEAITEDSHEIEKRAGDFLSGLDDRHGLPQRPLQTECPPVTHACVPYYLCINGIINTSGENIIDIRSSLRRCTDPDNPHLQSVCCRHADAVEPEERCPPEFVCVEPNQCNENGTINTDGSDIIDIRAHRQLQVCVLDTDSYDIGVCCRLIPPVLEICPRPLICLPEGQCNIGYVGDVCFINRQDYITGICCEPTTVTCPRDSECISQHECRGEILDKTGIFIPVRDGNGEWSKCIPQSSGEGVCCRYTDPGYVAATMCGVRNSGHGGRSQSTLAKNLAKFGEFPWQAIIFLSNYTFKCGASLVGEKWVITGAHCVDGFRPSDIKVRLGEWQVNSNEEPLPFIDVDVTSIYVHPRFNSRNLHNNIAVVELEVPIQLQYHINTICLPFTNIVEDEGTYCTATGWGKEAFGGSFQVILHKVDVPFVKHQRCQYLLRRTRLGRRFILDRSFACFGGEENRDACTGDGGGPVACLNPLNGKYYLHGITSWGIECGRKDVPGVYADVKFFEEWIDGIIYA